MSQRLIIGTRGSLLAMTQTNLVADELRAAHPSLTVELCKISTTGDRRQDVPLPQIGAKGLFTEELEQALLDGRIDLAVHSAKDLPTEMPERLTLGCVPQREDPRDAFLAATVSRLEDLPDGALIGTSSLRRQAQLAHLRPDFKFTALRGNIDTRIKKLQRGDCHATLLAAAGLNRAGLADQITHHLDVDQFVPAPGQGCLGLQSRDDDERVNGLLAPLHHAPSARALGAERAITTQLEGGCRAPIGVLVEVEADQLRCHAVVAMPDGSRLVRATTQNTSVEELIKETVDILVTGGAREIIQHCRSMESET